MVAHPDIEPGKNLSGGFLFSPIDSICALVLDTNLTFFQGLTHPDQIRVLLGFAWLQTVAKVSR